MFNQALARTAHFWSALRTAYRWVHAAAHLLDDPAGLSGNQVKRRLSGLLGAMVRWQPHSGDLAPAVAHFLKITRSYWAGLFHCYDVPGLPRTNNDLEHLFGQQRYHQRRITGGKVASASLVVRGTVRLIATVMTCLHSFSATDLAPPSVADWRSLRTELNILRQQRTLQQCFRRDPDAYLADLEHRLVQLILPL